MNIIVDGWCMLPTALRVLLRACYYCWCVHVIIAQSVLLRTCYDCTESAAACMLFAVLRVLLRACVLFAVPRVQLRACYLPAVPRVPLRACYLLL